MAVNDTAADISGFLAEGGWSLPVMLPADDAAADYGVRAIPTLFVLDAEGRIVKKIIGGATAAELTALIDGLTG